MDDAFAREVLECIDDHLRVAEHRAFVPRVELVDALLDVRAVVDRLMTLEHLEDECRDVPEPTPSRRRMVWSRSS